VPPPKSAAAKPGAKGGKKSKVDKEAEKAATEEEARKAEEQRARKAEADR
jgi:hypothetical protein